MITFTHVVQDQLGIHARPAGMLVKLAKRYASTITLESGENAVNLRKLMALMGMCVKCGDTVTVRVSGDDEEQAAKEVQAFFEAQV